MSKHPTAKTTQPDAWMKLVLQGMGIAELRAELSGDSLSADERRWMQDELRRKEQGPTTQQLIAEAQFRARHQKAVR